MAVRWSQIARPGSSYAPRLSEIARRAKDFARRWSDFPRAFRQSLELSARTVRCERSCSSVESDPSGGERNPSGEEPDRSGVEPSHTSGERDRSGVEPNHARTATRATTSSTKSYGSPLYPQKGKVQRRPRRGAPELPEVHDSAPAGAGGQRGVSRVLPKSAGGTPPARRHISIN